MLAIAQLLLSLQIAPVPASDSLMQAVVTAVQTATASPDIRLPPGRIMVDMDAVKAVAGAPLAKPEVPAQWGTYNQAEWERCIASSSENPSSCFQPSTRYVQVAEVRRNEDGSLLVIGSIRSLRSAAVPARKVIPEGDSRFTLRYVFHVELGPSSGGWKVLRGAGVHVH